MKKMKLFAAVFAAVAAFAAVGGSAEEEVEKWYTPDSWDNTAVKSGFTVGATTYTCEWCYDEESKNWNYYDTIPAASEGIAVAVKEALWAQIQARDNTDRIEKLANTIYNKAITKIEPNDNGGYKFYTSNGGGGNDYSGSIDIPKYTIENAGDEFELMKDGKSIVGSKKWKAFSGVDEISLENYSAGSGQEAKVRIKGWHNPSQHHALSDLADSLTNEYSITRNYQLVARASTGGLNYVDLGRLNIGQLVAGGCGEADECSITTNAEGNVGKMALYGFHDNTTDIGAIPYCNLNQLEWLNPTVTGAVLVSGGTGGSPAFTAKSERNYYYGTSKPADPGETVLGWHELPNVTTNYVEGDERTITADNTIDEESGEVCKKLKLYTEPTGNNWTEDRVYGAYMDGEGHLAWQPIIGDKIAPLLADGITTTNNGGKVGIYGFADAQTLTYLRKASSNSVEWASLGGLVAAKHGIVLEPNTNSQFIVTMQNYTNKATRSTATARNNVLLSRDVDGNLEWLTDVDMVGLQQIVGIGAVKAEPDGQISSAYDVKLRPSSDMGTVITGVDNDGNWTRMEVAGMMTNYWHLLPRDVVTNLVNDIYVKRAGDDMFGPLEIRAGLTATTAGFNEMTSGVAVVTGAMSADTLTVTNVCNLPFFDQTFVSYGTNETGEVLSCDLNEFTAMVAGDVAAVAAAEKVSEATNAMAQAWTVDTLNVNYTANLGVATTIGGEYPALVESGNSQIKFYVDDTSGELHVKAGERHWKVQMTEVFGPTP